MKKINKIMAAALAFSVSLGCAACGTGGTGNSSTGAGNSTIKASFADLNTLGTGFNSKYYPDASSVTQYSGTIDVVLDFDTNINGWKEVAKEYERLQSGAVKVNLLDTFTGSSYTSRLMTELLDYTKTTWDIVEGNLGGGQTNTACLNVKSFSSRNNPYCGANTRWTEVLEKNAFINVESGLEDSYIVNAENMQTCWFINDVAFAEAVEAGYKNSEGKAEYPVTWNDLISLCECMEEKGYTNPLGISLSEASIGSSQFSWLLRIYGDYYYRQYYQYITRAEEWKDYDPTAEQIERVNGYNVKYSKIANIMLDKTATEATTNGCGYVGVESDVFVDFITNLAKMKGHLMQNEENTEFTDARDKFQSQGEGKKSPQIFLDYLGNGVIMQKSENEGFKLGYFDYPTMESDYVDKDTITRDIGGNGGFLSVVKHQGQGNQNELNLDFMMFFLSPYGQTFYYRGLAAANAAPKGLSMVKNNLFTISEEWTDFYEEAEKTISFNGNVDGNPFLSWGVRYFSGLTNTAGYSKEGWQGLIGSDMGASEKTIKQFLSEWSGKCMLDYKLKCKESSWPEDMYKDFNGNY